MKSATNRTLILVSELEKKTKDAQARYVKNILTSYDDKSFRVSTQWGITQIEENIYPLLSKLGYSYTKKMPYDSTDGEIISK